MQNTLAATGVQSRTALYNIRKMGPVSPGKRGPKSKPVLDGIDSFDRAAIRRLISRMYVEKSWPTLASVHDKVKAEIPGFTASKSTLRTLLKDMGYKYSVRPSRELLKERPDII